MFKNPLKFQNGGPISDAQKEEMNEFITWLGDSVEGFKGKSKEEIAKAVVDMSKSDEGKASVDELYKKYKTAKKSAKKSRFADGGKFEQFICKHVHGGNVDCGCGGMKVVRGEEGLITETPANVKTKVVYPEGEYGTRYTYVGTPQQFRVAKTNPEGQYFAEGLIVKEEQPVNSYVKWTNMLKRPAGTEPLQVVYKEPVVRRISAVPTDNGGVDYVYDPVQSKQDGGQIEMGQNGLIARIGDDSRRKAKDAFKEKNFSSNRVFRSEWRDLKRNLRQSGMNILQAEQTASDIMQRDRFDATTPFTSSAQLNLGNPISGLESTYGNGRWAGNEIGQPGATVVADRVVKSTPIAVRQEEKPVEYGPVVDTSKQKSYTDAWYQYLAERAAYDYKNRVARPNQDAAAYQHWMWEDFNNAWDRNAGRVKSDYIMTSPSQSDLLRYRNAGQFTHGVLPISRSRWGEYGVDLENPMFYVQDDSRYRADAASHGTPNTDDLYNGLARSMGTMIAPAYGEAAAQAINGIVDVAAGAYTGFNPTGVVMKRPGVLRNPATGRPVQVRNVNGTFGNNVQGSWYQDIYNGQRVPGYRVAGFKLGGNLTK